jgi:hypothetical protein
VAVHTINLSTSRQELPVNYVTRNRAYFGAALLAASGMASAVDTVDFASITSGLAVGSIAAGILAVALLKTAPLVAAWGSRKILAMIGR